MLNAWVVLLSIFTVAYVVIYLCISCFYSVLSAGVYLVHFLQTNDDITNEAQDAFAKSAGKKAGVKIKKDSTAGRAGSRLYDFGKDVAGYMLFKALPYPLSAFYFLHWQIGVTAFAFAIIPGILGIWATYQALGIRNYFATNPAAYKNQSVSDGPLFNDNSSDEEAQLDSDPSENSMETEPLSKRSSKFASSVKSYDVASTKTNRTKHIPSFVSDAKPLVVKGTRVV